MSLWKESAGNELEKEYLERSVKINEINPVKTFFFNIAKATKTF